MIIILGTKVRVIERSSGEFYCPNCNSRRPYKLKRYAKYFTLFFIPLFQIKNLGEMERKLLDPYIEQIKPFTQDPQQYVRDQAKAIINYYEGKDLSSLMANFETLNKEVKDSREE